MFSTTVAKCVALHRTDCYRDTNIITKANKNTITNTNASTNKKCKYKYKWKNIKYNFKFQLWGCSIAVGKCVAKSRPQKYNFAFSLLWKVPRLFWFTKIAGKFSFVDDYLTIFSEMASKNQINTWSMLSSLLK